MANNRMNGIQILASALICHGFHTNILSEILSRKYGYFGSTTKAHQSYGLPEVTHLGMKYGDSANPVYTVGVIFLPPGRDFINT